MAVRFFKKLERIFVGFVLAVLLFLGGCSSVSQPQGSDDSFLTVTEGVTNSRVQAVLRMGIYTPPEASKLSASYFDNFRLALISELKSSGVTAYGIDYNPDGSFWSKGQHILSISEPRTEIIVRGKTILGLRTISTVNLLVPDGQGGYDTPYKSILEIVTKNEALEEGYFTVPFYQSAKKIISALKQLHWVPVQDV